ncbi:carbohydrate ABC transporter permease [Gryllotalpicola kribbensis]|uniref:Carbohydrate ABC transporter permease n=1 Tax=Gryllotalpicola kribbensis TaxID=993084 RepID=A0ABP8AQ95_9MICO
MSESTMPAESFGRTVIGRAPRAAARRRGGVSFAPRWTRALKSVVVVLAAVFFLLPIAYLAMVSFMRPDDILSDRVVPSGLSWQNWSSAFDRFPVVDYLRNSLIVAAAAMVIALLIAIPANYAMARLRAGGKNIMTVIVSAYVAPPIVAIVPLFILVRKVGLMDSLVGLSLVEGLMVVPVAIWLLDDFFRNVPEEIDEAAQIDGCGPIATLVRVVLPLVAPGVVAVGIVSFILVYNDFLIPLMLSYSESTQTLPVGISLMQGGREVMYGQMAAASFTGMIPVYLLALFMQRWLIGGLTQGSVK